MVVVEVVEVVVEEVAEDDSSSKTEEVELDAVDNFVKNDPVVVVSVSGRV